MSAPARIVAIKLKISYAFLVRGDKPVLVDTGSPNEGARIRAALETENVLPANLSLILHTHGHSDHCGSTWELKQLTRAPAAVHAADAGMMRSGRNGPLIPTRFFSRILLPFVNVPFRGLEPDLLVDETFSLQPYGLDARVVETPGHTSGSISLLFENGDAICGDLLIGGYLGGALRPHEPDYHYYAESLTVVRENIRKLIHLGVKKFYVAHGGPLDSRDIIRRFSGEIDF